MKKYDTSCHRIGNLNKEETRVKKGDEADGNVDVSGG
jgi:hypothetical protein